MKLSTKGRYGVRLMIELAQHDGEGPVMLRQIAERQDISEKYLWHLINPLKAAGLIHATRGARGGYVLAKPASAISIADILQVLEGPLCLVDCVENASLCKQSPFCAARDLWTEVSQTLIEKLQAIKLSDLLERQKRHNTKRTCDYSI